MKWEVDLHDEFVSEYGELDKDVLDELLAHIELLEQFGPQLGWPRVDTLDGSRHANIRNCGLMRATVSGASFSRSTRSAERLSCAAVTNQAAARSVSIASKPMIGSMRIWL